MTTQAQRNGLSDRSLAQRMTETARSITRQTSVEELLNHIVSSAALNIPGVEHAGISLSDRRGIRTAAATDDLVFEADRLQYALGEGPCVDTINGQPQALVNNLAVDDRWPAYAPRAVKLGLRSQLGVELYRQDGTVAALNLYSRRTAAFDWDTVDIAHLFATYAAAAMGKVLTESQLQAALESRKVIGQAIGILMERYQLDEQRAFAFLTRLSQSGNVKVRVLAAELVDEFNRAHASTNRS